MALFQKNPYSTTQHIPLFTVGLNKTALIVGLGNPGKKYEGTRHNIGFLCLDEFAKAHEFDKWTDKKDMKCVVASKGMGDTRIILCKPTTFMNLSGEAVSRLAHFYKVPLEQTVAVHDELDIPFGQIRMRMGGSDAGHNGIRSLIQHLGTDFGRVRIGIGEKPKEIEGADFVLTKWKTDEKELLPALTREVTSILTEFIYRGDLTPETRSFIV